ncbi:hypothetical protein TWF694_008281 [Orbilia ellipsospora]|uniref:F-box domain-containing protein n=1 Tax=Orbilia ellipsospora TaxID=2528407 RepID=A0AAV9XH00_9PEZI
MDTQPNPIAPNAKPAATILTIPIELQEQILSNLTLLDQLAASHICPLWRTIILTRLPFLKSRYASIIHTTANNQIIIEWKEYDIPFNNHIFITWKNLDEPHFFFKVQNGILKSFTHKHVDPFTNYATRISQMDKKNESLDTRWRDISECTFLDDPVFSPFDEINFPDDDNTLPLFWKKKAIREPEEDILFETVENTKYDYYDPTDHETSEGEESENKSTLCRTGPEFTASVTSGDNTQWRPDRWQAHVRIRKNTTVGELMREMLRESVGIVGRFGIHTPQEHELFFYTGNDETGVWHISAGYIEQYVLTL